MPLNTAFTAAQLILDILLPEGIGKGGEKNVLLCCSIADPQNDSMLASFGREVRDYLQSWLTA